MSDKRIKGCPNDKCDDYKKIKYKAEDRFCKSCGTELIFVCSKCWTPLAGDDPKKKICAKCEAKREDRKEKLIQTGKRAGQAVASLAAVAPAVLKLITKVLPTNKK